MKSHLSQSGIGAKVAAIFLLLLGVAMGTSASLRANTMLVVSPDKSHGQFTTLTAAIKAIPSHSKIPVTILIRPGIYHEHIVFPENEPPITLLGEDPNNTILVDSLIAYDKGPNGKPIGTFSTQSTWVQDNHFSAANITFANDAGISGNG